MPHSSDSSISQSCSDEEVEEEEEEGEEEENFQKIENLNKNPPDARSRFSANKALFQRMEKQAESLFNKEKHQQQQNNRLLPCFYSPRLQRSSSASLGFNTTTTTPNKQQQQQPPLIPPKPLIENTNNNQKYPIPGSPLTQLARNFSQFASDVERIASESRIVANEGGDDKTK
uniref:Uncharacterized protein n=1 Tax=Meloidogyne incognita TaxID=6306 RepID=A0A914MUP7_MELIC